MKNTSSSNLAEIAKNIKLVVFDFDGVFTDNRVLVWEDGSEGVLCSRADGFGLEKLRKIGVRLLVISTEENPVVTARCHKLHLRCIQASKDKGQTLQNEAQKAGIPLDEVVFMGNDINDVKPMSLVGLPVCVADAYPEARQHALYITKAKGGYGAVREFCEYLVNIKKDPLYKEEKKKGNYG